LRDRHDAAAGRGKDKPADDQQHPYRPLQQACATKVADIGLIALDAAADEQDGEALQSRQAQRLEPGVVALQWMSDADSAPPMPLRFIQVTALQYHGLLVLGNRFRLALLRMRQGSTKV